MHGKFRTAMTSLVLLTSGCDNSQKKDAPAPPASFQADAELPSGKLDRRNLIEFAVAVRDYAPKDEFSPQAFNDAPLAGRIFRIDLNMADPQNVDLPKLFSYDVDKKVLELSLWPGPIQIFQKRTKLPSEARSNAFGATVQVTRTEIEGFSVGPIINQYDHDRNKKPEEMGVFKMKSEYINYLERSEYSFSELEKNIPMNPEMARDISRDMHLVFEGVITKHDNGKSVECARNMRGKATITSPSEVIFNECTVSARFTRIQITSPNAGILASWE